MSEDAPPTDSAVSAPDQSADVDMPSNDTALPADIRKQVEQEQALADAQKRLKTLEDDNEKLRREKKDMEEARDGAVTTTNQLRTQLSQLQTTHHTSSSELNVIQMRIEAVESEKRELIEEVERLQQRASKGTQELYALRTQRTETSAKLAHFDVEVSELKMAAESSKFNETRATQALQGARQEILNLSKGAAEVEERFGKYRAEKQAEVSDLQVQFDNLTSRLSAAESSHHALQRSYNDVTQRLAEAHANIARLTSVAAERKTSTALELNRLMDENRILEKRGDDARQAILDREAELERITDSYAEKERQWEDKWKKEERVRREAEKRAEDLKVVVDRLAMASGEGNGISPAAALANGARTGGKTYTQFYMDYTLLDGKLRASENEVSRLTQILDEISADLAEKQPLLDEQQIERDAAIERSTALAAQLATVMAARDAHEAKAKSLAASTLHHTEEVASLRASADDLSRQVQSLLRQLAIRDDPSLANTAIDAPAPSEGDLITNHLVEFRSIRGLQEQNQKLLTMTRGLMAKLDAQEIKRATADGDDLDTAATLGEATQTINRLHAQLLETQKKINETTRERDFFSKLLAKGEGLRWSPSGVVNGSAVDSDAPHQQTIMSLQTELESIRTKADGEVQDIRDQLRVKSEAAGVAEVEKAKADAKATLLEEQHRILNEANTLQKQEYANLDQQFRQLQGVLNQAQNERKSAQEQIAGKQAEVDRLRNDAANLRAEKEQWQAGQSNEYRLQTDFRAVQNERAKLQQLIDNLNSVNAESEKTRSEERQRMEKRVEEVQREMAVLRTQLQEARDATSAAEKRASEIDSRVESATTSLKAEKEAADSLATTRQGQIDKLTSDLEAARKDVDTKHSIGMRWKSRGDQLIAEAKTRTETLAARDQTVTELNEKVAGLTKELEGTKAKITELEKKVADTDRGNHAKDLTVQRLQSELSKAQAGGAAKPAPAPAATADSSEELTTLRTERDLLQQQLAQAKTDLETAHTSAASAATSAAPTGDSASSGAVTDAERTELQSKIKAAEDETAAFKTRYDEGVIKVNRVNQKLSQDKTALQTRVAELEGEKSKTDARIAELQKEITELKQKLESAGGSTSGAVTDQSAIDEAVKSAVAKRESELNTAHQAILAAGTPDQAAIQAAVSAKEAELNASFESRLAEARSSAGATSGDDGTKLKAEVEDLKSKLKAAERQNKTAEISRKTLERTKETLEAKVNGLEAKLKEKGVDPATASPVATPTATSTSAGPAKAPATSTAAPVATPAGPSSQTAGAMRGTAPARGARARGTAIRGGVGRGGAAAKNPVLNAVNATLSQSPATPTSPSQSLKRPAPEDGEITEQAAATGTASSTPTTTDEQNKPAEGIVNKIQGAAQAQGGARVLKRPRGGGTAGRGGGARRPSGPGGAGGAGGAAGSGTGGDGAAS